MLAGCGLEDMPLKRDDEGFILRRVVVLSLRRLGVKQVLVLNRFL